MRYSSASLCRDQIVVCGNRLSIQPQRKPLLFEFAMFLLFTAVAIAIGLVTIDLLTEVRV